MKLNNIHFRDIETADVHEIPGRGDLRIVLTSQCNLKCSHCHNEGNLPPWEAVKYEVKINRIENLLKVASSNGAKSVKFTGGDPTVHGNFLELLQKIADWRNIYKPIKKWGISTNGIYFLKPRYFDALVNSELDNICIGLDSLEKDDMSKPSSPSGVSGQRLFNEFIIPLSNSWGERSIKVNVVFDGDRTRVDNVISACVEAGINVSVIEINGVMGTQHETRKAFTELYHYTKEKFVAIEKYNQQMNELTLIPDGRTKRISFYQDHCANMDCGHCRNIHLRVSSDAEKTQVVPCFLKDQAAGYRIDNGLTIDPRRFKVAMNINGRGPDWKNYAESYEAEFFK